MNYGIEKCPDPIKKYIMPEIKDWLLGSSKYSTAHSDVML